MPKVGNLAGQADEVYALFNNNHVTTRRGAPRFRGLLDAGIRATGGIEPPPMAPTLF